MAIDQSAHPKRLSMHIKKSLKIKNLNNQMKNNPTN